MLIYKEAVQLPLECENCQEKDCGECDIAGKRWVLSPRSQLELQRKLKLKAIEKLKREIAELDNQLSRLSD